MTDRAALHSPRPRPGVAALVLAVLVPVLLWVGTGNTFAAHLGPGAHLVGQEATTAGTDAGHAGSARGVGTVPHDAGSSHVLHLLGGCIAVLGAALLVLGVWRAPRHERISERPSRVGVVPPGRYRSAWWRPPALSPPTTSPVMRT